MVFRLAWAHKNTQATNKDETVLAFFPSVKILVHFKRNKETTPNYEEPAGMSTNLNSAFRSYHDSGTDHSLE